MLWVDGVIDSSFGSHFIELIGFIWMKSLNCWISYDLSRVSHLEVSKRCTQLRSDCSYKCRCRLSTQMTKMWKQHAWSCCITFHWCMEALFEIANENEWNLRKWIWMKNIENFIKSSRVIKFKFIFLSEHFQLLLLDAAASVVFSACDSL